MAPTVADTIHKHFSQYPQRKYPKGQLLIFADENPEHIFYIVKGRVRKYDVSYRGDEIIIIVFQPPAFFPMSWAINKTPNKFFYKTETEVTIHVIPTEHALQLLKDYPEVTLNLLSRLYKGLEGMYGRLTHLMSGTAKSRLLYELIIECRRFSQKQTDGSFILELNEVDLAARSGLSRETVSREMKKIKGPGWVIIGKNGLTVTDITRLEKELGGEV